MPDIEGVPYETTGTPLDQASAQALAARHREAATAGTNAGAAAQAAAKTYTDNAVSSAVAPLATKAELSVATANLVTEAALADALEDFDPGDQLPEGGTAGQVLTKTTTGETWSDAPTGIPAGGSTGQALMRTSSGVGWGTPESIAKWDADKLAIARGFYEVVSATEPESPTYTASNGQTYPVVWSRPIEQVVPVAPQEPFWDWNNEAVGVPDLVGLEYFIASTAKDGETTPRNIVLPAGQVTPLDTLVSGMVMPYDVTVSVRATPGYLLTEDRSWTMTFADPNAATLVASDTFTAVAPDGPPWQADNGLGGTVTAGWSTWGPASAARFTPNGSILKPNNTETRLPDNYASVISPFGTAPNVAVEFDIRAIGAKVTDVSLAVFTVALGGLTLEGMPGSMRLKATEFAGGQTTVGIADTAQFLGTWRLERIGATVRAISPTGKEYIGTSTVAKPTNGWRADVGHIKGSDAGTEFDNFKFYTFGGA